MKEVGWGLKQEGEEKPLTTHQRGQPRALLGSARAVVWVGWRGCKGVLLRAPPGMGQNQLGREAGRVLEWGGLTLHISAPPPGQSLNFSRGALDSEALGLEPGCWRPWGLRTVGWVKFSEKIRPREGTKALWGPGGWRQAARAGKRALLGKQNLKL